MELEELKNLWKKQDAAFRPRNEVEIAAMLHGSSKSIVSKLKRNVWIELALTLIAGLALLIYAVTLEESALKNISIIILITFLGYSAYYVKKLILLSRFEPGSDNVRSSIEKLIQNLSSYLKYYRLSYTILYPVYFFLGVIFGGLSQGAEHFFDLLTETRTIILLVVLSILFYFSSTWLVKWLLQKMYGNHLEKLKLLLTDLQNG